MTICGILCNVNPSSNHIQNIIYRNNRNIPVEVMPTVMRIVDKTIAPASGTAWVLIDTKKH